jgi:PST family polysaccharide transporter
MPGVVFMIATSDWLVLFLLGPKWSGSARIFAMLGVAAIVQPVTRTALWLFTTQGRTREIFKWGVMGGVIAVGSIIAGLPWGATGVAASYAVTDLCVATPILFWYVGRKGPVRALDLYRTIAPAVCASAGSLAVLLLSRHWLENFSHLTARLGLAFGITVAVSFLILVALRPGRLAMQNLKDVFMSFLKKKAELAVPVVGES